MGLSPEQIDFPASRDYRAFLEGRRPRRSTRVSVVPIITDINAAAFLRELKRNLSRLPNSLFEQTTPPQPALSVAESNEGK